MYAILDIETTGGNYDEEGITEIAIYRYDGEHVTDQFSSLVNPQISIQPFVVKLTGINENMLKNAPKFYEIAKQAAASCSHVKIKGLMGMATFTSDTDQIKTEFQKLAQLYQKNSEFEVLSMGMSGDYPIAIEAGSNMIRVGSKLFGERNY